jgi:hypothetical protein
MTRSFHAALFGLVVGCEAATTAAPDATACGGPTTLECYHATDGLCGDSLGFPVCSGGVWTCPAGTTRGSACRCFLSFNGSDAAGSCSCGARGWECPDAGPVAPRFVACGDTLRCDRNTQYCQEVSGGATAGSRYSCQAIPGACIVDPSCPCIAPEPGAGTCRPAAEQSFHVSIVLP